VSGFSELAGVGLAEALRLQGITEPTAVQERAVPPITEGRDVIASSETGTGKTMAYLIPTVMKLDPDIKQPQVIILLPTHELASQVHKQAALLLKNIGAEREAALVIGGANAGRQTDALKRKPFIIVGSAGRILELIRSGKLKAHSVRTVILDEADRLVDEINYGPVAAVLKCTLKDRQVLAFSATVGEGTLVRLKDLMKDPVILNVGRGTNSPKAARPALPENFQHCLFVSEQRDKIKLLRKIINGRNIKKAIVFLNNTHSIEMIAERLNHHNIRAGALYGNMLKNDRRNVLNAFRKGGIAVLAASDMAARGLDIKDLTHIINYDVPEDPEVYLHRAGRTGRMGGFGTVITLANEWEMQFVHRIGKEFKIHFI